MSETHDEIKLLKDKNRKLPPYHAKDCPDTVEQGNDYHLYISRKNEEGKYKWYKIKTKSSPDEYYRQFPDYELPLHDTSFFTDVIPSLTQELKNIGIEFFYIDWKQYGDSAFTYEYFEEDVISKLPLGTSYVYTSERNVYLASLEKNGKIYLQHAIVKDKQHLFNNIFNDFFPNRTRGYETDNDAIKIELVEKKKIRAEKEKTLCYVQMTFKDKKLSMPGVDIIKKYEKILRKLGKMSAHDMVVSRGYFTFEINVIKGKETEFEELMKNQEIAGLPELKKIEVIR